MARSVYFDPFGQRLAGFQAGINDQIKIEQGTRQARASDYDYNVIAPLRLENMQRENDFQNYNDPYRRRNVDLAERTGEGNYFDAEAQRRMSTASRNGNWALPEIYDQSRYSPTAALGGGMVDAPAGPATPQYQAYNDLQAAMQPSEVNPYGIQVGSARYDQAVQQLAMQYGITPEQMGAAPPNPAYQAFTMLQGQAEQEGAQPGTPQFDTIVNNTAAAFGITPEQIFSSQAGQAPVAGQAPMAPAPTGQVYQSPTYYQQNPYTGQMTQYQTGPNSYQQYGLAPAALQMAEFGVRQQNANTQQGYQNAKTGQIENQTADDGSQPYYLQ